jgi:hypothetical protein
MLRVIVKARGRGYEMGRIDTCFNRVVPLPAVLVGGNRRAGFVIRCPVQEAFGNELELACKGTELAFLLECFMVGCIAGIAFGKPAEAVITLTILSDRRDIITLLREGFPGNYIAQVGLLPKALAPVKLGAAFGEILSAHYIFCHEPKPSRRFLPKRALPQKYFQ